MTIVDNGPFDANPAPGVISDPGALMVPGTQPIPDLPFSYSLVIMFVVVAAVYLGIRQKILPNFKRF